MPCRKNHLRSPVRSSEADELTGSLAPTESGTSTPPGQALEAPAQVPAVVPAPAKYTNDDLQRITKLCRKSFPQGQGGRKSPWGGQLKARFPDLYYGKSPMDYYHICQKCEDHFDTAVAMGCNRTPFVASFFRGPISFRWHQHKL